MAGNRIALRLEAAISAVLPRTAAIQCVHQDGHLIQINLNGEIVQVLWLGEGRLKQARELITNQEERPEIVVARHMSPATRELLSDAGIGWVDETGAAEIVRKSVIISKSGQASKISTPREQHQWPPSVLATAEVLLAGVKATVNSIQEATGLSAGSSTNALRTLYELGLLHASARHGRNSGRKITDPDDLLAKYTAAVATVTPAAAIRIGVTWQDPIMGLGIVGSQWEKVGVKWAATGAAAAAALRASYLTTITTADVYVDARTIAGLESIAEKADLKPMEGGRLTIRPFPTTATKLLSRVAGNFRLAPWPRVYADLYLSGVRGEEAAEYLKERIYDQ